MLDRIKTLLIGRPGLTLGVGAFAGISCLALFYLMGTTDKAASVICAVVVSVLLVVFRGYLARILPKKAPEDSDHQATTLAQFAELCKPFYVVSGSLVAFYFAQNQSDLAKQQTIFVENQTRIQVLEQRNLATTAATEAAFKEIEATFASKDSTPDELRRALKRLPKLASRTTELMIDDHDDGHGLWIAKDYRYLRTAKGLLLKFFKHQYPARLESLLSSEGIPYDKGSALSKAQLEVMKMMEPVSTELVVCLHRFGPPPDDQLIKECESRTSREEQTGLVTTIFRCSKSLKKKPDLKNIYLARSLWDWASRENGVARRPKEKGPKARGFIPGPRLEPAAGEFKDGSAVLDLSYLDGDATRNICFVAAGIGNRRFTVKFAQGSNLRGAWLMGANLGRGIFSDCDFTDARLDHAELKEADCKGANFTNCWLSQEQIKAAVTDTRTGLSKAKLF